LKSLQITHVLINISKDDKMPAQIKSKILKVIKMLSSDTFVDSFQPKEYYRPASRRTGSNNHNPNQKPPLPDSRPVVKPYHPSTKSGPGLGGVDYNFNDPDHEDFIKKVQFNPDNPEGDRLATGNSANSVAKRLQYQTNQTYAGIDPSPHISQQAGANFSKRETLSRNGNEKMKQQSYQYGRGGEDSKVQRTFDNYKPHFGGGDPQESLYLEYVSLLDPSNTKELQSFAIQNLSSIIDDCVFGIMQNKPIFLKLLGLVELNFGTEDREHQKRVLLSLAKHLTEDRASDGIADQIIERTLKAFNRAGHDFHEVFAALIFAHIVKSNYDVRVNALVEMLKTPYIKLQDLAIKIMKDISKPGHGLKRDYTIEFENHIRFILESSLSKDRSVSQINDIIEIMANLCINDYLCPEVIHHNGIETLLLHLREKANVEGQRLAARGLLNLGAKSRENKLRIISELNYEIKALHRNELDTVVRSYISTLVQSKGAPSGGS